MMRCVDSRPDKQLNCVIDNGCFDFVEKYLNDSENERQHIIFMQKTQGVKLNLND